MKYVFLSDEWFTEAQKIMDAHGPQQAHADLRMNLVITGTPFDSDVEMHIQAVDGKGDWGRGHVENADVTLTTDFATARDIFVSGNPQAGMQAFMSGKVRVQGDMAKLMAAGQGGPGGSPELAPQLQEITE
ncbi:MAG: SCP2 sterol-binding domain-containing protein [Acidimicrobiia bacterium]